MSYQVLARKWRPRTFRELVGQQHVLQALVNALDHNRLHHAYLFTGTRGVGKTTIARILAKCLNCETGVSSEPCGQCPACVEINEGRFVDLIEVDAASRTKVEDTRELLENVQYAPTRGRYKVYLIDEVHMLSSHSFNALLKTLEEPPPHVKFLLATTDPQKLPVTILSRCLQFHLKNMDPERIVGHLQNVLEQEMVPFEEAALWQLGRAADGSMRDAMSLTDQAIAFGGGKVADAEVSAMLGTIDQNLVFQVLEALASGQGPQVLQAVEQLSEHAPDYGSALADLLSVLHRIAIAQALPEAVDNSRGDRDHILQLAQQLPAEDVQLFYQTALLGRRDLPMSPDPRAGFEMVLLRMLAFRPQGVHSVPTQPLPASAPVASAPIVSPPAAAPSQAPAAPAPTAPVEAPAPAKKSEAGDMAAVAAGEPVAPPPQAAPAAPQAPAVGEEPQRVVDQEPQRVVDQDTQPAGQQTQPVAAPTPEPEIKPDLAPLAADPVDPTLRNGGAGTGLSAEQMASMGLQSARAIPTPPPEAAEPEKPALAKLPLANLQPEQWIQLYTGLGVGGVLQSTVSNCQLLKVQGNQLQFVLDQANSMLYDPSHQQRLSDMLSQYFGEPVTAVIEQGAIIGETPAAFAIRLKQEQYDSALQALRSDPLVQQLLQQFEGQLDEESVQPLGH
ncbi:DNA polymerase III subunit gamma/tau [Pseudomaricurvus alkylphenolicus]|uniref:DNA polymerase III subunit gamma/tau n=1 Tax=Pseudomaricurvus alkylphenolicus TaxID=1306991 RepID=UPI0014242624|nr:DNA polymerase III subunit gamma/tau [Pseudomaricurvus alkylphenolicus]NIB44425.1 DNA polymerase III subunit gamma/tau [Pseudomaricurvus alkylphenolicus]